MIWTALKIFWALAFLTGCLYPLLITVIANLTMPYQAKGSLLIVNGQIKGSELIAQPFVSDKYFWPRPSAINYDPLHSGGSNLGPTSKKLKDLVQERALKLSQAHLSEISSVPAELVYASGSGLDPHLSEKGILFQLDRVAKARNLSPSQIEELRKIIQSQLDISGSGYVGPRTLNVLKLNRAIDESFNKKAK